MNTIIDATLHRPGLEMRNLSVTYDTEQGPLHTVRDVSLDIAPGEIYGLVGESGSGKTTLARAIVRYLPGNGRVSNGAVSLDGVNLLNLPMAQVRRIWGAKITMVHQDPNAAVNPSIVIGEQIAEMARTHLHLSRSQAWAKALEMLAKVRMPDPDVVARRYAHQLSGGQLQRVLIATALTTNPRLLIMDEPTTALESPPRPSSLTWCATSCWNTRQPSSTSPTISAWWRASVIAWA